MSVVNDASMLTLSCGIISSRISWCLDDWHMARNILLVCSSPLITTSFLGCTASRIVLTDDRSARPCASTYAIVHRSSTSTD